MKKVALFGGTFNPIHLGHLIAAEDVRRSLKLDNIIFVPVGNPAHKNRKRLIDAKHRYNMAKLAIRGNPKFAISDYEIKKEGRSYSIETVNYFKEELGKNVKLFFIIGSDIVPELHTWEGIKNLIKLCDFIIMTRPGYVTSENKIKKIGKLVHIKNEDISSREIRKLARKRDSIRYLVPKEVEKYIYENKLYR